MTESLPDRLSVDPRSKYYDEALLARGVGIKFNGVERTNVEEYCVSEGWIRSADRQDARPQGSAAHDHAEGCRRALSQGP